MAERLGTGLQNLLQRFDSAWHLKKPAISRWFFEYIYYRGKTPGPPPSFHSKVTNLLTVVDLQIPRKTPGPPPSLRSKVTDLSGLVGALVEVILKMGLVCG